MSSSDNTTFRHYRSGGHSKWLMAAIALATLVVVTILDGITGKDYTFTLLYFIPIAIGTAFIGPFSGFVLCLLATLLGMLVAFQDDAPVSAAVWNASIRFGVFLIFYGLLTFVLEDKVSEAMIARARKLVLAGVVLGVVFLLAAAAFQRLAPQDPTLPVKGEVTSAAGDTSGDSVSARSAAEGPAATPIPLDESGARSQ